MICVYSHGVTILARLHKHSFVSQTLSEQVKPLCLAVPPIRPLTSPKNKPLNLHWHLCLQAWENTAGTHIKQPGIQTWR